jgi:hypothetical protein
MRVDTDFTEEIAVLEGNFQRSVNICDSACFASVLRNKKEGEQRAFGIVPIYV